jgi:hypothetical protein
MNANTEIVIGSKGAEHVSLEISNRSYEDWHSASIGIRCDGWQGNVRGHFRKGELSRFAQEVRQLHRDLSGTARLNPLEPNVTLTLTGDGKGHITVTGVARDNFARKVFLDFQFSIDQTYLPAIADSLSDADPPTGPGL